MLLLSKSTTAYVFERYISPLFLKRISYCCVVLPVLVVNVDSPRYARKAHSSLVHVLETHILLYTGSAAHTCCQCLRSVQGYMRGSRCLYMRYVSYCSTNHGERVFSAPEFSDDTDFGRTLFSEQNGTTYLFRTVSDNCS